MKFPDSFIWGAAASSYQIEGSTQGVDGCGSSVWDECCKRNGFVKYGDHGFTACDHYNRYREDVGLMKEIGLQAYRFSVMWPRVMPEGTGSVNKKGLSFYDRLVDELLGAGITPWTTLFHWDYPLALFNRGGWLNEDSPKWFEDYTRVIVDCLSDRVKHWFTLNEPTCFIGLGHMDGTHAPGVKYSAGEVSRAWHHALLAHGRAVRVIRGESRQPGPLVGAAPCFRTTIPDTERPEDIEAARQSMFKTEGITLWNAVWSLDPCFGLGYPEDALKEWGEHAPVVRDGDLELIAQKLDFLGMNIYSGDRVKAGPDGKPETVPYPSYHPRTQMGWPVAPDALRWAVRFLYDRYRHPVLITENGLSQHDWVAEDGHVHDAGRIDFLTRYLRGLHKTMEEGVPVLGYFHWSIMDNFEWAEGYVPRFGMIHVDYPTQKRTLKDSALWYRSVIRANALPAR